MSEQRCKFADPKHGGHHCGSYAFNLSSAGIKQGEFCDTHYWQSRCEKAEAALATQPQAPQEPTEAMLLAGATSIIDGQESRPGTSWAEEAGMAYKAMLRAAPTETPEAGK